MPIILSFALALCGVRLWDQFRGPINQKEKRAFWFLRQLFFGVLGFLVISLGSGKFFTYRPFEFIVMIFFTPVILYFLYLSKIKTNIGERWIECIGIFLLILAASVEVGNDLMRDSLAFGVCVFILVLGAVIANFKASADSKSWVLYSIAFALVGVLARGAPL